MKRTIALFLLVILLAAAFAACGAKTQEEKPIETPPSEKEAAQKPTEEPAQEPTEEPASEEPEEKIDLPGVTILEFPNLSTPMGLVKELGKAKKRWMSITVRMKFWKIFKLHPCLNLVQQ